MDARLVLVIGCNEPYKEITNSNVRNNTCLRFGCWNSVYPLPDAKVDYFVEHTISILVHNQYKFTDRNGEVLDLSDPNDSAMIRQHIKQHIIMPLNGHVLGQGRGHYNNVGNPRTKKLIRVSMEAYGSGGTSALTKIHIAPELLQLGVLFYDASTGTHYPPTEEFVSTTLNRLITEVRDEISQEQREKTSTAEMMALVGVLNGRMQNLSIENQQLREQYTQLLKHSQNLQTNNQTLMFALTSSFQHGGGVGVNNMSAGGYALNDNVGSGGYANNGGSTNNGMFASTSSYQGIGGGGGTNNGYGGGMDTNNVVSAANNPGIAAESMNDVGYYNASANGMVNASGGDSSIGRSNTPDDFMRVVEDIVTDGTATH